MHCCVCVWMHVWSEVCEWASGYLCGVFLCRNAVDWALYSGVWKHSEKEVLAQGLPLTFWPQGQDTRSFAQANANSRLVATWRSLPPQPQRGFTRLVTPCWKVMTRRSRVQPSLFSCHHQHSKHNPKHRPEHTPTATWHHSTNSQGVLRSCWQLTLTGRGLNARLYSMMRKVRWPQDFISPVWHN